MRMRPSADVRAPGLYQTVDPVATPALAISNTRIAGFIGLSQRGPMNEPIRISSWDDYVAIFGYEDRHYMSDSVHAFFRNGGTTCWICRIAHNAPRGQLPTLDQASCAEHVQIDDWNKPSLKILALNEGEWGNNIWFKCQHSTGAQALLIRDLDVGAGEAHVNVTRGFEVGALVRIYDRENSDYVVITEVADKLIKWSTSTPVNRKHRAA